MTKSNTTLTELAKAISNESVKIVDLTNTLSPDFPVIILPPEFGQCEQFKMETLSRYDGNGPAWYWNNISMNEHTGTHFDAPAHWVTGKNIPNNTVETIPVKDFVAPAVVINISEEAKINPDFLLTKEYLMEWEKIHGKIPPKNWIALRTDWYKLVGTEKYLNMHEDGAHSPGPDKSAIEFLVFERDCLGLAVETIGTDAGQAFDFDPPLPAHSILHGNGRYGLQCLKNLDKLPTFGSIIIANPLKIEQGSGSPLRVLALVNG
ncbi:MAG: cyclase family protein [Paracoccaceae bacterium]|jgi:kynurenine formamidase|nr:cyclase family protein [Paracoccaceae bacterium]MBV03565.1 cyclase [Paracoccaceae bacterium]MDG1880220.1 cyclase family protein [Paracoccaceae bacterium]MDG1940127.1 cyclase family protein [Paracoccaceae bacterium]|tara:strand:+ start:6286 stop:7074 length:789 start_codon:yes stop_codon:yes gene_type:complete